MSEVRRNEAKEKETSPTLGGSNFERDLYLLGGSNFEVLEEKPKKSQILGGSNFEVLLFPDAPESWKRELVRRRNRKSQTLGGSSFERDLYPLGGPNCKQERPIS